MAISFTVEPKEARIIERIAQRAVEVWGGDTWDYAMSITACHANGNPLDLERLLEADRGTFAHDVGGIHEDLSRRTGRLRRFMPRTSRQAVAS